MPQSGRSLPLSIPYIIAALSKLRYSNLIAGVLLFFLVVQPGPVQGQTPPAPAQTNGRVIVKIKPSLAAETEAQFSSTMAAKSMWIRAGQSGNARLDAFMQRQSAHQISPMYPEILRAKRQHGWSDEQIADHIRQHFAKRGRRVTHAKAVPEISRTYVLDFGSLTPQEQARTLQRLKADPDVEFAEPTHTFSTNQLPSDPFLTTSGTWGQPYQDLWGLFAINAPAAWDTTQGDGIVVAVVDTGRGLYPS